MGVGEASGSHVGLLRQAALQDVVNTEVQP